MLGRRRSHTVVGGRHAHVLESSGDETRDHERITDEVPWVQIGDGLRSNDSRAFARASKPPPLPMRTPPLRLKVQSILCAVYDAMLQDRLDTSVVPRLGSRGDLIANEIKRAILSGRTRPGVHSLKRRSRMSWAPRRPGPRCSQGSERDGARDLEQPPRYLGQDRRLSDGAGRL